MLSSLLEIVIDAVYLWLFEMVIMAIRNGCCCCMKFKTVYMTVLRL